jgi:hypothetical protein
MCSIITGPNLFQHSIQEMGYYEAIRMYYSSSNNDLSTNHIKEKCQMYNGMVWAHLDGRFHHAQSQTKRARKQGFNITALHDYVRNICVTPPPWKVLPKYHWSQEVVEQETQRLIKLNRTDLL